ncbi:filamentous hemagglutinin N-terminal domain-containing protein [Paraburkholderia sp. DGU8]|uniref:two-partner secretion domain-containing protein n=1 Tax=Paraburkholderia sp. DGU8 TaxID=3161997 RepID=UPI0034666F2B
MTCPGLSRPARRALRRQQSCGRIWLAIGISLTGLCLTPVAFAAGVLPQGGHYVAGAGTIAGQGNALIVTQPGSTRGVIDWNRFSIGKANTVSFDNGSGATLNRVTGGSPSAILGNLNATGSVYVINPQGVLVGPAGVISTGGRFVAATLDLPDSAFMTGGTLTLAGSSNAKVVNLGKISSSGGDVFLIAHDAVVNAGSVSAPNGTAEYAAGQQVVLYESSSTRQVFVQISSNGTVVDRGTTQAAQINLEAADGNIYALAGSGPRIRATGTAMRDGHIWLVAGDGHVTQQGTLAATNADGRDGTVDTLANTLTLKSDAAVHAGLWNVSTPNFTVDTTTADAFVRSLNAGTSIDATATGANGANGDMTVASNLAWTGPASLALVAFRNVSIAPTTTLKNTGSGNLSLRADAASIDNGGSVANHGTIDWSGSTGLVSSLYDMNGSYSPGTILANSAWTAAPYSGLVTQVTSYKLLNSLNDLQNISLDLAGNYALGKDIDEGNSAFTTLGYSSATPFTGQFDGMRHTISNISPRFAAVFNDIGAQGVVRDVNVNSKVGTTVFFFDGAGILAIHNHGTVANVFTSGSIASSGGSDSGDSFAGLVATNYGLIARSGSSATVTADGSVAGLVLANQGTITQSYSIGPVSGISSHGPAGGLVGSNSGTITQSFVSGPVRSVSREVGGVCSGCGGLGNDVYWDVQTTGQPSSGGNLPASNGLTTAQMSTPVSFAGWDFGPNGVWAMPAGATHPVLRWQLGP